MPHNDTSAILFDETPYTAEYTKRQLTNYIQNIELCIAFDEMKVHLYESCDLIFIQSYMLRNSETFKALCNLSSNIPKIIISPINPVPSDLDSYKQLGVYDVLVTDNTYQEIFELINNFIDDICVFELSTLTALELSESEARNTVEQALPRIKKLIMDCQIAIMISMLKALLLKSIIFTEWRYMEGWSLLNLN